MENHRKRREPLAPDAWATLAAGLIWIVFTLMRDALSRDQSSCFLVILAAAWALPVPSLWVKGRQTDDEQQRRRSLQWAAIRLAALVLTLWVVFS